MLPLYTTRLILRRFTEADMEPFLVYRNDPDVARYQSWEGCSRTEVEAFMRGQQTQEPGVPGQWFQIAIALKEAGTLLGDCALRIHSPEARQATVGITLAQPNQGQGFATEALACLLDYLFRQRHLHRVVADTDPQNLPAWTLLERLGMRREGHLRQSLWFKGQWADEYLYAILCEEWLAKQG
jgi:RimJ/RimL family protein N-acetyltransferase